MERGNKVIDERVSEWLEALKIASCQFEDFVTYAEDRGAVRFYASGEMFAFFENGWAASAQLVCPDGRCPYVSCSSWRHDSIVMDTSMTAPNDWRAAVDRAASGGAS